MTDKNTLADKTQNLLEYPKIMEKAASYALSEEAAAVLRESKPVYVKEEAEKLKELVIALYNLKIFYGDDPSAWLPSIGFLLPKIKTEGNVLELDEVLAVALFIERGTELKNWVIKERSNKDIKPDISPLIEMLKEEKLPCLKNIAAEIFKIIDKEGNLRDLPVLRAIRNRISSLERELKTAVSRYTSDDDTKRMLQSPLPSQRDGRIVLALKANFKGRIKGIVHEVSSSGQTIFVEPLDIIEKNNEILLEKRNLDAEIHKLLRELTEKILSSAEELQTFHLTIIELECLRARASYSASVKGCFARQGDNEEKESIKLKQARHPMLKNAVPVDISMNSVTRTLIITGPNTGGKTVALKTLGLFAMMNQSALALPLDDGSCLPYFDGIYADIGDEQSIDQSLSTFSAHITNISAIIKNATENSLVLLDELGSGTDPEEGSVIAMAILDHLIEKKSRMVITTHHGVLKNYGYTRQGVENASVEFNLQTLKPSYKIINGLPGESRALDIASANGLDPKIIERARNYLDKEKPDISAIVKGLKEKQKEIDEIEQNILTEQKKLKEDRRKADLKELQLRQKETELKRESFTSLKVFLSESRKTLENLVRELKEGEIDREKTMKVKEFLNDLARNVENESETLAEEERALREHKALMKTGSAPNTVFSAGMEVYAGTSKQQGVIVREGKKTAAGNTWIVEIGSLKVSFPESELIPAVKRQVSGKTGVSWAAEYNTAGDAVYELKLLGMRLEDAKEALRRQIDAAVLNGLKNFAVIHGKGTGVLQHGIHEYLKKDPAVSDYYFARPELGGFGRTEVVLR